MSPRQSSNREFGLVMASAFFLFTLVSAWKHKGMPTLALPLACLAFAFLAFLLPKALTPLNMAWSMLGRLLHRLVSPIVLGVLYFFVFTPFGLFLRIVKGDSLRLKMEPEVKSYWINREPDDQPGKGMANQF